MLYREIFRILGVFFLFFTIVLFVPLVFAEYYDPSFVNDFFFAIGVSFFFGAVFYALGGNSKGVFYRKEGIAAVVLMWFLVPVISALPFLTSKTLNSPLHAYFEMVSGYTTTGATILHAKKYNQEGIEIPIVHTIPGVIPTTYTFHGTVSPVRSAETNQIAKEGVEAVSHALIFWRSFTQWLGGAGIVVLFVAILPALGIGRKMLYRSEVSLQSQEGQIPRIKQTAIQLWKIYLFLTFLQIVILMFVNPNLSFFEAINITFATISTGGFSTQNSNISGYNSTSMEWVVVVFMILGSISFSLYYFLFKGKFYRLIQPEFIVFLMLLIGLSALVIFSLGIGLDSVRNGVFQLVSAHSSTGFFTVNYDVWPYAAQIILIMAMFFGGMAGSTSGGLKVIRHIILFKSGQYRVESLLRPEQVRIFKIGEREIEPQTAISVLCFFLIAVAVSSLSTLLYVYDGIDIETAFSLTVCMLNNSGMAFRMAGPEFSCAFLSDFSLSLSIFLMIFGRLEYYAILALLVPAFWRDEN